MKQFAIEQSWLGSGEWEPIRYVDREEDAKFLLDSWNKREKFGSKYRIVEVHEIRTPLGQSKAKMVVVFESEDGYRFNTEDECRKHEDQRERTGVIMKQLNSIPGTMLSKFQGGEGYIQQHESVFLKVRNDLLVLAKEFTDHRWIQDSISNPGSHPSHVARALDDYNLKAIGKAWYRIMCTDSQYREWGQPYYRENPEAAKRVCLNSSQE